MEARKPWIALALAAIAGAVDCIGYLVLARVFTSHMSGNTVAVTVALATGQWHEAWRHFEPIVAFFGGALLGMAAADALLRLKVSRVFSIIAGLEVAFLVVFVVLAHPAQQWMTLWPAAAMGIQNALLRRAGDHSVRTTFITGMLATTAHHLVCALEALANRDAEFGKEFHDFLYYAGIPALFAAGGLCGALLDLRVGVVAVLLPASALALLAFSNIVRPVAADWTKSHAS